jgi:hypothetical protein
MRRQRSAGTLLHPGETIYEQMNRLTLRACGENRLTVLPEFSRRSSYWTLPPTSSSNAYLRYLLAKWSDDLLAESAKTPEKNWFFLFFHEHAVFGGDLVQPTAGKASAPTVLTFFEMALGAPNPRPPWP